MLLNINASRYLNGQKAEESEDKLFGGEGTREVQSHEEVRHFYFEVLLLYLLVNIF
jgi:hypothetical protein